MNPRISIIVAVAQNGVIGQRNALPWRLSADLKRFRALTMHHPIIMGRRTYQSIGRPLPGRRMIVVTSDKAWQAPDCERASSLAHAVELSAASDETFVIGGASIYELALPLAHRLYWTAVHAAPEGDTFFPAVNWHDWREVSREHLPADTANEYSHDFIVYDRI